MGRKVKRIFSLVPKTQNTIQLFNQLNGLVSHEQKKVEIFGGIIKSINEISRNLQTNKTNFNWIMLIISNPVYLKSITKENYLQIEKDLANLKINLLVITVGVPKDKYFHKLQKSLNFRNKTVFLDIKSKEETSKSKIFKRNTRRLSAQPNMEFRPIRALMSNISNIKTIEQNLVYEKF